MCLANVEGYIMGLRCKEKSVLQSPGFTVLWPLFNTNGAPETVVNIEVINTEMLRLMDSNQS